MFTVFENNKCDLIISGGAVHVEKMNLVTRSVLEKLSGESGNVYNIGIESFNRFISGLKIDFH
jgi:predicted outer membrane repeat protein